MRRLTRRCCLRREVRSGGLIILAATVLLTSLQGKAQNTPLISGGVGFLTNTTAGSTSYLPIAEPLFTAPLGDHVLVESRAAILDSVSPKGGGQPGYDHDFLAALTYLQGDFIVSPHLTVVAGSFLIPFGTYNERLSPVWINPLQDGPLIANLGAMSSGTALGGQLRGSAISRRKYSVDYAAYFSARSGDKQFLAKRSDGARVEMYLPDSRLEVGFSYDRLLQNTHENFYGVHVWWEPRDEGLRLRSEYAHGQHGQGYWVEADYRSAAFGGFDSWVGRFQPIFRMQQTFRIDSLASDGLPAANTQRADFGLDYNLPHNTTILTSYSRQFSPNRNENIWETGIVYRLLFPAWKGK